MLQLAPEHRHALWQQVTAAIEDYALQVDTLRVSPKLDPAAIRESLQAIDLSKPTTPEAAIQFAVQGLTNHQVHTPHPRYFGLFNPAPTTMGIAADALVGAFNPQIAAWSHSPFAAEAESYLIEQIGAKFGYAQIDGAFTPGGMEANHTAILTALAHQFPIWKDKGLRALPGQPILFISSESHHSFKKAARLAGLGDASIREVSVDSALKMDPASLKNLIETEKQAGNLPFFVGATAGTTNAGVIDPLRPLAEIAAEEKLWFHTDAAWGGGAALVPELSRHLDGIQLSDSITFDAHKWLSVPMGAGVYLTRHPEIMDKTFRVTTAYMPQEAAHLDIVDPHLHTMQWSRRFIGLKLLLSLMVAGWDGYAAAIRHQTDMGNLLRQKLQQAGWEIANDTPLPVVCFRKPQANANIQKQIASQVVTSGEAWISTTLLRGTDTVLRACITNYNTKPADIEALVATLDRIKLA